LIAHGFTIEQMVDLVHAGLATAKAERVVAGGRAIEVARVRITEAGRRALAKAQRPGGRRVTGAGSSALEVLSEATTFSKKDISATIRADVM
jgi:hypothetical protein